jgi:hypothetical protein
MGGRLTLIKYLIEDIPIYWHSFQEEFLCVFEQFASSTYGKEAWNI